MSFYSKKYHDALMVMGSRSGRDCDKTAMAGLTPEVVSDAVTFKEAEVTFLCRKIYHQDMIPDNMPQDVVNEHYTTEAPHRMYIGEVVDIITKP